MEGGRSARNRFVGTRRSGTSFANRARGEALEDAIGSFALGSTRTRVGECLGPYRLESVMAETAMAIVYRAIDQRTGGEVCVKTLHPMRSREDPLIRRFQREARLAMLLTNPNTVRVLDHGDAEDGTLFLVMELLIGKTLRNVLRVHGTLGVATVADIGVQICRSLEEAHRHGIVHRDLKPENVFVCEDREGRPLVRVLDYGCARLAHGVEPGPGPEPELRTLTVVGTLIGTPQYMSPEQCTASEVDRRSDLYSLGVMLFEMLSGKAPFEDELPLRLLSRQITEPPPPLTAPDPIPAALDELVGSLLQKEPARRPARALDVLEVLLDLLEAPERKSALGLEGTSSDDTVASLPPFDQFEPEVTVRDMEMPPGMLDEEHEEDRTVPWTSPFGLQSITLRDFGAPPAPGDEPTMPERRGKK